MAHYRFGDSNILDEYRSRLRLVANLVISRQNRGAASFHPELPLKLSISTDGHIPASSICLLVTRVGGHQSPFSVTSTAFASQAFAQVDTQPRPPNRTSISEHRAMALKKCTDNITFASDRYVACMQSEGEEP